jgi:hypothetical protein
MKNKILQLIATIYPSVILFSTVMIFAEKGGFMFGFEYVFTGIMLVSALVGLYLVWRNNGKKKEENQVVESSKTSAVEASTESSENRSDTHKDSKKQKSVQKKRKAQKQRSRK